jgi:hypothetical protein
MAASLPRALHGERISELNLEDTSEFLAPSASAKNNECAIVKRNDDGGVLCHEGGG